jgi:DNA polymerase III subunit beta
MQLSALQENLTRGLGFVSRAVAARSTLPVLGNILLATDQARLKLAATDLEISITCWIGAKVETAGAITVPARTLIDLISALPAGVVDMNLHVQTQTLGVMGGRFANNIKGVDAQDFPIIPRPDEDHAIRIAPDVLREAIDQVVFAASTNDSRPILRGVLAKFSGQTLTLAAADGFRLSVRTVSLEDRLIEPIEVVIPARALVELSRLLGEPTDVVSITVTPQRSQILFHLTNLDLVSQLIDGQFPVYDAIIPKSSTTKSVIDTALLLKAAKAANVFARESANIARLTIVPGDELTPGHITIGAQSAETGDNAGDLEASITGDPIEIAFNVKYLIDVLSVVGTNQITLETSDATRPGLIRPLGDDTFTHVIMPMHIGGR